MANYPTTAVQYGQTSPDVTTLQNFLISQGMSIPAGATGYFGDQTKSALTQWQSSKGITGAGIGTNWGPQSIAKAATSSTSTTQAQNQTSSAPFNQNPYSQTSSPITTPPPSGGQSLQTQSYPGYTIPSSINNNPITQSTPTQINNFDPNTGQPLSPGQSVSYNGQTYTQGQSGSSPTISPTNTASSTNIVQYDPNTGKSLSPGQSVIYNGMQYTQGQPMPTSAIPGLTPGMQNLTVSNLPNEAFNGPTSSTQLMPGTPEYQAAMDKLDTSFYDVMQQQMTAQTEQQQQVAEYNWQTLKSQAESTLNVNLSNNAMNAWSQIQGLKNNANPYFGGRNIEGSGLEAQSIDTYLQSIRASDAASRTSEKNSETSNQQAYYQKFATPDQVQALVQSNPALAQQWGLTPSSDVASQFTAAALKAKYPTMSDADIQSTIASVLDTNGNYRSNLYQQYMTGSNNTINPGSVGQTTSDQYGNPIVTNVTPSDSGILDIQAAKKTYQTINTPYASQAADDASRKALGSTPPTSGAASGTAAGTQFNQITPPAGTNLPPAAGLTYTPSGPNQPITPQQMANNQTIAANQNTPAPNIASPIPTNNQSTTSPAISPKPVSGSSQNNPLGTSSNSSSNNLYTVKSGDTLAGLYGNNWKTLSGYTGDPTKLQIGTQLPKTGMLGSM